MKLLFRFLTVLLAGLLLAQGIAFAQTNVRGKVTGSDGQALAGVTVMIQGTTVGTSTDLDGSWSLQVSKGAVLEFASLGMKTVTRSYKGEARIDVVLEEDALYLDDVVVVGYGTAKKETLTAAVSAIKGDELLKSPSTNVSQVLAGKLSGLSSVQESGEPGLDQASIRIRGSVYAVSYVVDGFPVSDINDIDPADIESVSVLKDGASAAVYGLKAAGGVIIITTKKGGKGDVHISYNGSVGVSMNANFPRFMDGPQYAYYYNVAQMMDQMANGTISSPDQYVPYFSLENVQAMTNGDPTDGWDNVNYIQKVFGTGLNNKHNITLQGGTDKTRYFVGAGYMGQKGNIDGYNYTRYNLRANVESKVGENLTFTVGLSGVVGNRRTPRFASGGSDGAESGYEVGYFSVAHQTIGMWPFLPEKVGGYYTGTVANNQSTPYSPLAALYESGNSLTRSLSAQANMSLAWDIPWVKGLQLKVSGAYDNSNSYNKNLATPYYVVTHDRAADGSWSWSGPKVDVNGTADGNKLGEGTSYSESLTGQLGITYAGSFGKHNVDALMLAEIRDWKTNNLSAYVKNLPFALLPELSNGTPTSAPVLGSSNISRSAGYVGRVRYNYDEKYLAEFTGRLDGSYKFAGMASTRWGFFPSVSLGWRASQEDFLKDVSFLDDLKLRASVGLLGSDNVSAFMFLSQYTSGSSDKVVYTGSDAVPYYYTSGVPNKDLTWEKTLSYNVGVDFSLWNGLLGGEIDGFYNYTYDILTYNGGGHSASMGGYYPTYINKNAIDSKGIDILLTHKNRFDLGGKPLFYEVAATLTYSKTRWLVYQDSPNIPEWQKVTGTTYNSLWGWKADGLYRSEEEIDNSAWYGTRPNVGDIKYVDLNGDGKIDWDDRGIFGKSNRPELTYGLNLNLGWNGFDMNLQFTGGALFQVSLTGTYYNGYDDNTIWTQTFKEGGNSPLFMVENAYSVYNPEGTWPRLTLATTGHGGDNGLSSSFWWLDGKYIRLKTAQLGYTLPKQFTRKFGVEGLRIFVEGNNLFTIDGLPEGIDPESPGVNNGYYPQQRYVMGGITLTL